MLVSFAFSILNYILTSLKSLAKSLATSVELWFYSSCSVVSAKLVSLFAYWDPLNPLGNICFICGRVDDNITSSALSCWSYFLYYNWKRLDLKEAKCILKLYMSQPDMIRALNLSVLTMQHFPRQNFFLLTNFDNYHKINPNKYLALGRSVNIIFVKTH